MEGEYHSLSPGLSCASLLPPLCSLLPSIAANTELPLVEQDLITLHSWQPEAWVSPAASAPIRSLHTLLPLSLQLLLKSFELSLPSTCVPAELPRHGHLVLCRERPVGFSGPAVHCPQGPLPPHPSGPFPCRLVHGKNSPGGNFIFYCQASPWLLCATRVSVLALIFLLWLPLCCWLHSDREVSQVPCTAATGRRRRGVRGVEAPCWLCASYKSPAG